MARPKKQGLDYFPLDVDFFEDPKIAAIAGEFGVKGEIVAVKLLCAIYREGYFVEWNDMLRLRFLRSLTGISADLLDSVVSRLVKWEFFEKNLFSSAGILTSKGIQRRFFEITKRRSLSDKMPYLLVSVHKNTPGAGLLHAKTPQSKEKDIISSNESIISISSHTSNAHARDYEKLDEIPGVKQVDSCFPPQKGFAEKVPSVGNYATGIPQCMPEYIPVKKIPIFLSEETLWFESFCMNNCLSPEYVKAKIDEFAKDLENSGEISKDKRDCKKHFNNWLKRNRDYEARQTASNNIKLTSDNSKSRREQQLQERIAERMARTKARKMGE